jgi:hypothetical protein
VVVWLWQPGVEDVQTAAQAVEALATGNEGNRTILQVSHHVRCRQATLCPQSSLQP